MKNFKFNQIYVIQSLPIEFDALGDEKIQTGEQLYNDLLRWQEEKYSSLNVFLYKIQSMSEWNSLMDKILESCKNEGCIPILHLEIHGSKVQEVFTTGFVLGNGEHIDIKTIGEQLRQINIATQCNLFVTLAVCKGMSLLLNMNVEQPMPFVGAIGSFSEIYEKDLLLRYTEFYSELFNSFDIAKAYSALLKANSEMCAEYRYIPADELFIRNYQRYISEQCTPEAIKKRAAESEKLLTNPPRNRAERRKFQKVFSKQEEQKRSLYYKNAVNNYFLLSVFPDNKDRFDVPLTIDELMEKSKHLVTV